MCGPGTSPWSAGTSLPALIECHVHDMNRRYSIYSAYLAARDEYKSFPPYQKAAICISSLFSIWVWSLADDCIAKQQSWFSLAAIYAGGHGQRSSICTLHGPATLFHHTHKQVPLRAALLAHAPVVQSQLPNAIATCLTRCLQCCCQWS